MKRMGLKLEVGKRVADRSEVKRGLVDEGKPR